MKIRAGDTVVVISGKDAGKTGQVLRVLPRKNRVVVSDVNIRTRHMKRTPQRAGEIVKYEASLDVSNVMILDPKTKKRARVGYKKTEKGKFRIAKQSGEAIKKGAVATKKATSDAKVVDKAEAKVTKSKEQKAESKDAKTTDKKSPFWKKMGFGAEEMAGEGADVDAGSHMKEDHSVPDQIERSSTRGSSRGS